MFLDNLNEQLQNRQTHLRWRIRNRLFSHQIIQQSRSLDPIDCSHQTSIHLIPQHPKITPHPTTTPQTSTHRLHPSHLPLKFHHQHRHVARQVRPIHVDIRQLLPHPITHCQTHSLPNTTRTTCSTSKQCYPSRSQTLQCSHHTT